MVERISMKLGTLHQSDVTTEDGNDECERCNADVIFVVEEVCEVADISVRCPGLRDDYVVRDFWIQEAEQRDVDMNI